MEIVSQFKLPYIPEWFDDYPLTHGEYRILCRIFRRSRKPDRGQSGFTESIPNIAKRTGVSQALVRRSLNVLEKANVIHRTVRAGLPDRFVFCDPQEWAEPARLTQIREDVARPVKKSDAKRRSLKPLSEPQGVDSREPDSKQAPSGYGSDIQPLTVSEISGYGSDIQPLTVSTAKSIRSESNPLKVKEEKVGGDSAAADPKLEKRRLAAEKAGEILSVLEKMKI